MRLRPLSIGALVGVALIEAFGFPARGAWAWFALTVVIGIVREYHEYKVTR